MSTVGKQTIDEINIDFSRKQKWNLLYLEINVKIFKEVAHDIIIFLGGGGVK